MEEAHNEIVRDGVGDEDAEFELEGVILGDPLTEKEVVPECETLDELDTQTEVLLEKVAVEERHNEVVGEGEFETQRDTLLLNVGVEEAHNEGVCDNVREEEGDFELVGVILGDLVVEIELVTERDTQEVLVKQSEALTLCVVVAEKDEDWDKDGVRVDDTDRELEVERLGDLLEDIEEVPERV